MANVTRTAAPAPTAAASGPHRVGAPVRGQGASEASAIEGASGGGGVSNHQGFFQFQDFGEDGSGHRHSQAEQYIPPQHTSRFNTSSEAFASAMSAGEEWSGEGRSSVRGARGFAGLLVRAIKTYETNSQVIHGENKFRGNSMSFVL